VFTPPFEEATHGLVMCFKTVVKTVLKLNKYNNECLRCADAFRKRAAHRVALFV